MEEKIMSHILELPDTLYTALKEAADESGLTPLDWIATHLGQSQETKQESSEQEGSPQTLADLFTGRVGRIRSNGQERLSEECGAKFTDYLEEKRRTGRL
jgi:hypothetical protein